MKNKKDLESLLERIDKKRNELNKQIDISLSEKRRLSHKDIVAKNRELDKLIVKYTRLDIE